MTHDDIDGPSSAELAAIEMEWPLIAAELDLLDAEIAMLYAEDRGGPTVLDWRRVRRAEAAVTRAAEVVARTGTWEDPPPILSDPRRRVAPVGVAEAA
ncbi:hypothetical protein GCM10027290_59020 [Micromonospora sonneratiae]|uniref:DUF6284 family protein n=1 Tax=Micromonospora sonneratiae TaxID=1184706 RepID=A0ABW3Y6H9_9ACTN